MHPNQLQYARGERIIAAGRLLLAVFSLLALLLDRDVVPMATAPFMAVVVVYSLVLAGFAWRFPFATPKLRMLLHVADFLLAALLIFITHAAVSRFFVFFLFSIFSALVRFGVRGTLYTSGAAILTYVFLASFDDRMQSDAGYLLLRVASLTVITLFLAYIGALHERVRDELTRLASWPRPRGGSREEVVRETLALARDVLHAPRALLAWEDQEEPWVWCAESAEQTSLTREPPGFLESPPLQQRLGAHSAISTPVAGDTMQGRLFFLDRDDFTYDDVTLAEVVGRLVATRIDQLNVAERMRAAAVGEERIRVARDLHDGVLQSLTGAALQLASVHKLVGMQDDEARGRLRRVQELLEHDQRELRSLITHLRPATGETERRASPLEVRLSELAERFERQWDVAVSVTIAPPFPPLRDELSGAIYNIVHEAVSNSARHAHATRIDATVRARDGGRVEIVVTDDGHGFPFHGHFALAELDALRRGPVTLKERVASLGGELVLHSAPNGATLEIRI